MVAKVATIKNNERLVLTQLARLRYATSKQLFYWSCLQNLSSITRTLSNLRRGRLVETVDGLRPHVYFVTSAGLRVVGLSSAYASFFTMQKAMHAVHKNEAEIHLRHHEPTAIFQARSHARQFGLAPLHGEYLVRLDKHDALGLVDDYHMPSSRIVTSWVRSKELNKDATTASKSLIQSWAVATHEVLVFTTDAQQAERHRALLTNADACERALRAIKDKSIDDAVVDAIKSHSIPARVFHIEAVWQTYS